MHQFACQGSGINLTVSIAIHMGGGCTVAPGSGQAITITGVPPRLRKETIYARSDDFKRNAQRLLGGHVAAHGVTQCLPVASGVSYASV